ncbi:hypothetical protein [Rhabdochromatium marinum]|uniref:hypothetical protein n=1 Tax=Rhabdochromatium marinum TaxID=48729 RepID=UPI0019034028|nr:hypothetical protein [Rhabdochromatium marinum]MBK1649993.1 hypothetical protein [Rhabdochromatium marinum]
MTDSQAQTEKQARNAEILARLRANFGEERDNALADIDGFSMLSLFLRPLPRSPDAEPDADDAAKANANASLTHTDLAELRRQKRLRRRDAPSAHSLPVPPEAHQGSAGYANFLEQLPQLREQFGAWLASVDVDYIPSSSSLEELKALQAKTEQRLGLLKTMTAETQCELDQLIITIRAMEATQAE